MEWWTNSYSNRISKKILAVNTIKNISGKLYGFNTDYYLIYYSECNKWLGSHAFECIGIIQDYENDNFGEVTTDLSSSESVVNMYVYILGEDIVYNYENEVNN